jgi:alpha-L-arabinofuranosidase
MKTTLRPLAVLLLIAGLATTGHLRAQELAMNIDAGRPGAPIHHYVYGQFTELLGNMFEKGIWSEMLSDRKFFYPVDSSPTLNPRNTKRFFNRWRTVGPDDAIVMDKSKPFVGEHSPLIQLAADTPRGIIQSGLTLRKDRRYTGYMMLAGNPGARIEASLVWGEGKDQSQSVAMRLPTNKFTKYPFSFTAGADASNGQFSVTATGTGSIRVGVVSLMPADNVEGFRADMVALLRDLDQGMYRWPGGNFVSGYNWRDGVGDRDKRPPRYDYAWNTVEYNDVGTDEFMALCRLLRIDPYFCVNAGLGDAQSAADWVEYANGSALTPMGKLRAQNGHAEPYRIVWWGIGNEMYGEWQLGHIFIDQYVLKHNQFAGAMRAVDPAIKLIASGATPFETSTTARHHRKPLPAKLPYEYGSKQDWSYNLLEHCSDNIDFLAEHLYPVNDSAFDVDQQVFVVGNAPLVDRVRRTPNRVKATVDAWEEYLKLLPQLKDRNIKIAIDEWTGGRGTFAGTLGAAEGLQEMFRHSDVITMGAYTAFSSCLAVNGADSTYSTTGLIFKLYRQHFGVLPLPVTGNSPQHEVKGTVGVDKPAVSSGSSTYPLDVAAALSNDRKALTVAVVNPTDAPQNILLTFTQASLQAKATKWEVAVKDLQTQNVAGQEPRVKIVESSLSRIPDRLEVAPYSVTLYEFKVR